MTKKETGQSEEYIAKKDFVIRQNQYHIVIKKGDKLTPKVIPKQFFYNLKIENII